MNHKSATFALENGLDLRKVVTTGSVLHISEDFDETCAYNEPQNSDKSVDFLGQPVHCFEELEKTMATVDENGFVKKKILEEGGGFPLHDGNTVSVAFSGFWEGDMEPFDTRKLYKPLVVDLKDSGLLPGLDMSIRSMFVGETSVFLLSYQVMYGELGVPPRIKPKANCIFYIKLEKCIITDKEGKIDFSEPNMFQRVEQEVKILMCSGISFYKTNNILAAIQLFRKSVFMLHKCRLANENEEKIQENLLGKLYLNLANCYNKTKQPAKACTACNELKRLDKFWKNHKALFANAKALRMIGQFDVAEKRLKKAMHLCPKNKTLEEEFNILQRNRELCNQNKLLVAKIIQPKCDVLKKEFKDEVDNLIRKFKENDDLCILDIPSGLNSSELAYLQEACIKEKLFLNKKTKGLFDTNEEEVSSKKDNHNESVETYSLGKCEPTPWDADIEALQDKGFDEFMELMY